MSKSIEISEDILNKIHDYENQEARLKYSLVAKKNTEGKLQLLADKMSLLVDEEHTLMTRFSLNMKAFEQHFPDIHQFFENYSPDKKHLCIHENFANIHDDETGKCKRNLTLKQ